MTMLRDQLISERNRRRVRQWFYDFWDDHNWIIYFMAWGIVGLFIGYGIWVCVR